MSLKRNYCPSASTKERERARERESRGAHKTDCASKGSLLREFFKRSKDVGGTAGGGGGDDGGVGGTAALCSNGGSDGDGASKFPR